MAPAFVQGLERDPLRDDAHAYAAALRAAGVAVRHIQCVLFSVPSLGGVLTATGECRYPGVTHGFHYEYPAIGAAVKVRAELVQGIQWLLGKETGSS